MNTPEAKITRPMLRYFGGKFRLAPWIISHLPAHRIYVEPYGGAGSVLLRKERVYNEVYNDLDGEIVNLFRVCRSARAALVSLLEITPYSREEYALSFELAPCPLEQARRTFVRSYMGFGSNALCRSVRSGFRACSTRSGTTPAHDWRNFPGALAAIVARLQGVVIENRPALEVMAQHDTAETLHYCDPPYVHSTRAKWAGAGARAGYAHEMTDAEHSEMAGFLRTRKGAVVVSGYASPLYDELFAGWRRLTRATHADRALDRTEVLWIKS